jgi:hypothetical protein
MTTDFACGNQYSFSATEITPDKSPIALVALWPKRWPICRDLSCFTPRDKRSISAPAPPAPTDEAYLSMSPIWWRSTEYANCSRPFAVDGIWDMGFLIFDFRNSFWERSLYPAVQGPVTFSRIQRIFDLWRRRFTSFLRQTWSPREISWLSALKKQQQL